MKILAAAAAALAVCCSGSALAEPDLTVRVPAPGTYRMTADEFRDYAYSYELSNGRSVAFARKARRFYVALDGERADELYPLAQGVLMTAAGARIEFNPDGSAVTIRHYEKLPMAGTPAAANITVVALR